jgi:hypothetical protein
MADSFIDLLRCPSSQEQKQLILDESRRQRKAARVQENNVYLDYIPLPQGYSVQYWDFR